MNVLTSLAACTNRVTYFNKKNYLEARIGYVPSYTCRSIWLAKWVLQLGGLWRIGNGKTTRIWKNPWLLKQKGFKVWTPCNTLEPLAIADELMDNNNGWNIQLIQNIFLSFEANQITELPISISN